PLSTSDCRPGILPTALRAPVAITKASERISVLSARVTVLCSGSMVRTDPTTVVIPDNASELGWMETVSWSRHPRITHGSVKPRKCEKSVSLMVLSRSLRGTPDSRGSLLRLRPAIPAPRITSFLFTLFLFFVKRVLRATQVASRPYLVRAIWTGGYVKAIRGWGILLLARPLGP